MVAAVGCCWALLGAVFAFRLKLRSKKSPLCVGVWALLVQGVVWGGDDWGARGDGPGGHSTATLGTLCLKSQPAA